MRCAFLLVLVACGKPAPRACTTKISYPTNWVAPPNHPARFDIAEGNVTWDGTCTDDGTHSFAKLSNGSQVTFVGKQACELALDPSPGCGAPPTCKTRITYRPAQFNDVDGRVFSDGACHLSNGTIRLAAESCARSLRYTGCGGFYANPIIDHDCPDPDVVRDGTRYLLTCTSGNAPDAFPIFVSSDLIHWTQQAHILPAAARPAWAKNDFCAPEIHRIGAHWVAYFSARGADGKLAIGAAAADDPLGPYTALPAPIVPATTVGLIDANAFVANGTGYLLWKEDGNAQGAPTPIRARQLAPDGLSVTGETATLITNDRAWEGNLVEAPFVVEHDGAFYLFYSGNAFFDSRYAIGVARATSPLGPYARRSDPILTTAGAWVGPGHNAVVETPGGDTYLVYHAWALGHVNRPGDGRLVLIDQVQWRDGWPVVFGAPSSVSRPMP